MNKIPSPELQELRMLQQRYSQSQNLNQNHNRTFQQQPDAIFLKQQAEALQGITMGQQSGMAFHHQQQLQSRLTPAFSLDQIMRQQKALDAAQLFSPLAQAGLHPIVLTKALHSVRVGLEDYYQAHAKGGPTLAEAIVTQSTLKVVESCCSFPIPLPSFDVLSNLVRGSLEFLVRKSLEFVSNEGHKNVPTGVPPQLEAAVAAAAVVANTGNNETKNDQLKPSVRMIFDRLATEFKRAYKMARDEKDCELVVSKMYDELYKLCLPYENLYQSLPTRQILYPEIQKALESKCLDSPTHKSNTSTKKETSTLDAPIDLTNETAEEQVITTEKVSDTTQVTDETSKVENSAIKKRSLRNKPSAELSTNSVGDPEKKEEQAPLSFEAFAAAVAKTVPPTSQQQSVNNNNNLWQHLPTPQTNLNPMDVYRKAMDQYINREAALIVAREQEEAHRAAAMMSQRYLFQQPGVLRCDLLPPGSHGFATPKLSKPYQVAPVAIFTGDPETAPEIDLLNAKPATSLESTPNITQAMVPSNIPATTLSITPPTALSAGEAAPTFDLKQDGIQEDTASISDVGGSENRSKPTTVNIATKTNGTNPDSKAVDTNDGSLDNSQSSKPSRILASEQAGEADAKSLSRVKGKAIPSISSAIKIEGTKTKGTPIKDQGDAITTPTKKSKKTLQVRLAKVRSVKVKKKNETKKIPTGVKKAQEEIERLRDLQPQTRSIDSDLFNDIDYLLVKGSLNELESWIATNRPSIIKSIKLKEEEKPSKPKPMTDIAKKNTPSNSPKHANDRFEEAIFDRLSDEDEVVPEDADSDISSLGFAKVVSPDREEAPLSIQKQPSPSLTNCSANQADNKISFEIAKPKKSETGNSKWKKKKPTATKRKLPSDTKPIKEAAKEKDPDEASAVKNKNLRSSKTDTSKWNLNSRELSSTAKRLLKNIAPHNSPGNKIKGLSDVDSVLDIIQEGRPRRERKPVIAQEAVKATDFSQKIDKESNRVLDASREPSKEKKKKPSFQKRKALPDNKKEDKSMNDMSKGEKVSPKTSSDSKKCTQKRERQKLKPSSSKETVQKKQKVDPTSDVHSSDGGSIPNYLPESVQRALRRLAPHNSAGSTTAGDNDFIVKTALHSDTSRSRRSRKSTRYF